MRIYILPLLLVLLYIVNTDKVFSQKASFSKVTPPIGNFASIVGGIAQDQNGYMWFATGGGLYRYDGYRFKIYSHDPNNKNSISAERLETVYADSKGFIWIATWVNGIDRLDPVTGEFTHFKHDPNDPESLASDSVKCVMEDRDGIVWVGTNSGIDKFDPKTGKFKNYRHDPQDPNSLTCNHIRRIIESKDGTLWIATGTVWGEHCAPDEGGLNHFDKKTGKVVRHLHDPNDQSSLINNKIQGLYEDRRGTLWVGTAGDGLHTMDQQTGKFVRHSYDPAHPERLSRSPVVAEGVPEDHITFITEDVVGGIWIGTSKNGLVHYDPTTEKTNFYANENRADGFGRGSPWSWCSSKEGVLWIGTFEGSLYKVDPYQKKIPFVSMGVNVNFISEDQNNNIWFGTNKGIIIKNAGTDILKHNETSITRIGDKRVLSIFRDKDGTMWMTSEDGLSRYDYETKTFTPFHHNEKDSASIMEGPIVAMAEGTGDSLWVGGENGLTVMNKVTGKFTKPIAINGSTLKQVSSLTKDKAGNVWIGCYEGGGLYQHRGVADSARHFLNGKWIVALKEDGQGRILVSTDGQGIFFRQDSTADFSQFVNANDAYENMGVGQIAEDDQGYLWAGVFNGILKIDLIENDAVVYGVNEGVSQVGLRFRTGYKASRGMIYFGAEDGYHVVNPSKHLGNPNPPQVVITDIKVGGKSIQNDKVLELEQPLEATKDISLEYNQNSLSISFSGIHFSNPELNRHLYMLENYDRDWRDASIEMTAEYFNLPPGQYKFMVKAASNVGVWSENAITIIITPPWWRNFWAYVMYGLLFLGAIYGVDRIQRKRVIRMERERAQARELAQAKEIEKAYTELKVTQTQLIQSEKMASLGELTAGIAHEIQNPLNFVNNFSEVNSELIDELKKELTSGNSQSVEEIANNIKENQDKINHHGKRADAIVKSMLLHSRKSTGQKELTDINALCDEFLRLAYHGIRAKDKSFNAKYEIHCDSALERINVVPEEIGRVILNLINNAFYAVNQRSNKSNNHYVPTVLLTTKKSNDRILISIKDNGIGISDTVKEKIFQPFFTTKPAGHGTGLGLSLSYDVIKAHGGDLKVESVEGEGSEFIVSLPLAK